MSRQASFAILGASAALVVCAALFVFVGIAAGVWQPRGAPPSEPGASSRPGGMSIGARSYGDFLEDVRAGQVSHVFQQGQLLQVEGTGGSYTVDAPPGEDVVADVRDAATAGGVPIPAIEGEGLEPKNVSYEELLQEVKSGRVFELTEQGTQIHASEANQELLATVPSAETNVLEDVEDAARAGNVAPPVYTKVPPEQ
jgi:hypothetical protein